MQAMMVGCITLVTALLWDDTSTSAKLYATNVGVFAKSMLTLVSYMMGGFVALVVGNWFKRRLYYIAQVGNLKCLLCLTTGLISAHAKKGDPPEEVAERELLARACRETVNRYIVLVFELAILKVRATWGDPKCKATKL